MNSPDQRNDLERWNLLSTVANLYYNAELTQNQIAERFFTSRSKVSRMLKEARELGIVTITIREPWERNRELERRLEERLPLKNSRVLSAGGRDLPAVLRKLGEAAAYYLDSVIEKDSVLGISWGNTVYNTVKSIKTNKNIPLTVVPIMGAASASKPERDSLDLSKELAASYGGRYRYIYAPLFVKTRELRESLIQEPEIGETLRLAKSADLILTSVGSIVYKTWRNYLSRSALETLERRGAVGHIGGHFFSLDGEEIKTELSGRMIGIDLEDFHRARQVICVAGTQEKAGAILGAVRGGYIDALITDEEAAAKVLEMAQENITGKERR